MGLRQSGSSFLIYGISRISGKYHRFLPVFFDVCRPLSKFGITSQKRLGEPSALLMASCELATLRKGGEILAKKALVSQKTGVIVACKRIWNASDKKDCIYLFSIHFLVIILKNISFPSEYCTFL